MLATPLHYIFLAGAAGLGGLVNSVAGGGGFLVFPSLLKAGLLPIQANATGTVALWPGQFTSIAGYREDLRKNHRLVIPVVHRRPHRRPHRRAHPPARQSEFLPAPRPVSLPAGIDHLCPQRPRFAAWCAAAWRITRRTPSIAIRVRLVPLLAALLAITYYIGYFGAGAGLLTMTALALCGVERIAEINALKVVITTVANGVAVITFIIGGAVEWRFCWLMMIACAAGGYTGARNARRISDRILRPIIIVLGFSIAIYFFLHRKAM